MKSNAFRRLLGLIVPYWYLFLIAGLLMVLSAVFDGASLSMLVPISDRVLAGKPIRFPYELPDWLAVWVDKLNAIDPRDLLFYIGVAILVIYLAKAGVEFAYKYLMSDIAQRIIRDLRFKLYQRLQMLSMDFFARHKTGDLVSRLTNDVVVIQHSISYGITELVYQGGQVLVFSAIIFAIDWRLAVWMLVVIPLVVVPAVYIGRRVKKLTRRSQERIADINVLLIETLSGAKVVRAFASEDVEVERFREKNQDYYRLTMKRIAREILLSPLMEVLSAVVAVAILWYGGNLVLSGRLSFGVFALFLASLLSMVRPLKRLSNIHVFFQQAIGAMERIGEILDAEPSVVEVPRPRRFRFEDRIGFEDVWFRYDDRGWVLKGVSFEVPKGKVVALVGASGSGKSTLAGLLLRLYDPVKGRILIDGVDIREMDLKDLRRHMGLVPQELILFNDTLWNNITYGLKDVDEAQVEEAVRIAHISEFIHSLPKGYDTRIGDLGSQLSGGQRQRIAIARAILRDPPILILDEATSHLDAKSEKEVQSALSSAMQGRTVLVIAHRLSTIRSADLIVVLHEGEVVEVGRHEDLIARDGLYKSLYRLQSGEVIK